MSNPLGDAEEERGKRGRQMLARELPRQLSCPTVVPSCRADERGRAEVIVQVSRAACTVC